MIRSVFLAAMLFTSSPCGQGVTCPQLPDRDDTFNDELMAEIEQLQIPDATAVVQAAREDIRVRKYFARVCQGT